MTKFAVNVPVPTTQPFVVVDAGLPVGLHRFRLVVTDQDKRASHPSEIVVQILPPTVITVPPVISVTPVPPRVPIDQPGSVTTNPAGPVVAPVRRGTPAAPAKKPSKPRKKR